MSFFTSWFRSAVLSTSVEPVKEEIELIPETFYFNIDQHDIINLAYDHNRKCMEIRYFDRLNDKQAIEADCVFETYLLHLLRLQNKNLSNN